MRFKSVSTSPLPVAYYHSLARFDYRHTSSADDDTASASDWPQGLRWCIVNQDIA